MRFQARRRTPLGTAREQRRVVMLVGMLAIVIWSIFKSANPQNWVWLTGPANEPAQKQPEVDVEKLQREAAEAVMRRDDLPEGAFRSELPETPAPTEQPATETPTTDGSEQAQSLEVPPAVLAGIRDDHLYIRSSEIPAYWALFAKLQTHTQAEIDRLGARDITFAQIFSQPDAYRGQLITLEGELVQLEQIPVSKNAAGITQLWEGWFRNADSAANPYVFRTLEKPSGLPTGQNLHERIRITGYFFKRYNYAAKSGTSHAAPMFLVKRIGWFPQMQPREPDSRGVMWLVGLTAGLGLLLATALWWFMSLEQRRAQQRWQKMFQPQMKLPSGGIPEPLPEFVPPDIPEDDVPDPSAAEISEPAESGDQHTMTETPATVTIPGILAAGELLQQALDSRQPLEPALQQLLVSTQGWATGLWRVSPDGLELWQAGFAAHQDMPADVRTEFQSSTERVPLSKNNLGIVRAALSREPTPVIADTSPPDLAGSIGWLQRFRSQQSLSVPVFRGEQLVGVIAVSTLEKFGSDTPLWQGLCQLATHLHLPE